MSQEDTVVQGTVISFRIIEERAPYDAEKGMEGQRDFLPQPWSLKALGGQATGQPGREPAYFHFQGVQQPPELPVEDRCPTGGFT